jgi:hypothetical protein
MQFLKKLFSNRPPEHRNHSNSLLSEIRRGVKRLFIKTEEVKPVRRSVAISCQNVNWGYIEDARDKQLQSPAKDIVAMSDRNLFYAEYRHAPVPTRSVTVKPDIPTKTVAENDNNLADFLRPTPRISQFPNESIEGEISIATEDNSGLRVKPGAQPAVASAEGHSEVVGESAHDPELFALSEPFRDLRHIDEASGIPKERLQRFPLAMRYINYLEEEQYRAMLSTRTSLMNVRKSDSKYPLPVAIA